MSAPNREERKRCWESRDGYFACLERAKVVVPGREGGICNAENKVYENNCAASWVEYFNRQRVLADRQRRTIEAAEQQRLERQSK